MRRVKARAKCNAKLKRLYPTMKPDRRPRKRSRGPVQGYSIMASTRGTTPNSKRLKRLGWI